jgi:PTH1 family peptidyl-tRNA hydrolase
MSLPEGMKQSRRESNRDIKLVVGLGNPGSQYEGSRHNAGFRVMDILSARHGIRFGEYKFSSLIGYGKVAGKDVVLAKPLTYMNRSGFAVEAMMTRYNLRPGSILVILDDVALEQGRLRIRAKGSDGGHNGLKSIIDVVKTEEIPRLRIGIGMPGPSVDMRCHVLDWFEKEELPIISDALLRAADATAVWVEHGIDQVMNEFN